MNSLPGDTPPLADAPTTATTRGRKIGPNVS
jgi:hypothetical protein